MSATTPLHRLFAVQRHHRRPGFAAALGSVINKVLNLAPPTSPNTFRPSEVSIHGHEATR